MAKKADVSQKVLEEILKAFASEEQTRPSNGALRELAAATEKSQQEIKNLYHDKYVDAGGEGDPWGMDTPVHEG
jgi:hypothetical protein